MEYTSAQIETIKAKLNPVDEDETFSNWIDESHGVVTILGMEYLPSRVLRQVDPIAFRCECDNYIDSLVSDGELTEDIEGSRYKQCEVNALLWD